MEEEGGRRPKRRCNAGSQRRGANNLPSAIHYVGYVEEDETPEMIMKKFEELERVVAAGNAAPPQGGLQADSASPAPDTEAGAHAPGPLSSEVPRDLTDEQLMQVFKQTSVFNVKTALAGNEMMMDIDEMLGSAELSGEDFDSDDDDTTGLRDFWDEAGEAFDDAWTERKSRRSKTERSAGPRTVKGPSAHMQPRTHTVSTYNFNSNALIRRKVRLVGRDELYQLRIPNPPLPLSWGRAVAQYVPRELRGIKDMADRIAARFEDGAPETTTCTVEEEDIMRASLAASLKGPYQAVLIGAAWAGPRDGQYDAQQGTYHVSDVDAAIQRLARLPLPQLCPVGFVFIWAEKEHIHAVVKQMFKWRYSYVENLTWVYQAPNNAVLCLPAPFTARSHLTLFIFRKNGEGKDIELRHQRNADVVFHPLRNEKGQCKGVPDEAFVAIETLLPTGKGKFLELFAPHGVKRPGWTHVLEGLREQ